MFEKIGRLAETAATKVSVSRRGFLGRLGQGALAAAGTLGGLLLFTNDARAGGSVVCCYYRCHGRRHRYSSKTTCQKAGTTCDPTTDGNCGLIGSGTAADCKSC